MQNGTPPATVARADIGMRLVADVDSYERAGRLMDEIGAAVQRVLREQQALAEFDFTHFNTHPCKAGTMANYGASEDQIYDPGPTRAPALLTQH